MADGEDALATLIGRAAQMFEAELEDGAAVRTAQVLRSASEEEKAALAAMFLSSAGLDEGCGEYAPIFGVLLSGLRMMTS